MATKLALYNGALLECGERSLASLSENREPRRLLDQVWDTNAVDYCLSLGQWTFAKRSAEIAPDTGIDPGFGFTNAYLIPDDHVRTAGVWADERGQVPLTQYVVENKYWFADINPIFVSYVSNDASYGGDLTLWPPDFVRVVEVYLASRIARKLTQSLQDEDTLLKKMRMLLADASSGDAMENPTKFPPRGSWVRSRTSGARSDRGSRGDLIG